MKYYEKNYDSTSTLQYDIQYIKVKTETADHNVLDSLKSKGKTSRKRMYIKKIHFQCGKYCNFNSACKNNRKRKTCKKELGTHSTRKSNSESRIEKFMKLSKEGFTFVGVICNRCLYFRTNLLAI